MARDTLRRAADESPEAAPVGMKRVLLRARIALERQRRVAPAVPRQLLVQRRHLARRDIGPRRRVVRCQLHARQREAAPQRIAHQVCSRSAVRGARGTEAPEHEDA